MKDEKYDLGPALGRVVPKEELAILEDQSTLIPNNIGVFKFVPMEQQPFNFCFVDQGKEIGKFYYEDDQLCFDGALDKSGHVFIDYVLNIHNHQQKKLMKDAAKESAILALGWMIAEACVSLDNGEDLRNLDMSDILARATKDLKL